MQLPFVALLDAHRCCVSRAAGVLGMCHFEAERMSYATAAARCAAAPGGGGEVCHIIDPNTDKRYSNNGCNINSIRAPPPPSLQLSSLCDHAAVITLQDALPARGGRDVVE